MKKASWGTRLKKDLYKNRHYYLLLLLPIAYYIIFKYMPMFGNVIAFRKYRLGLSMYGTEWVGLRYFKLFMRDSSFWSAFSNTLILSVMNLVITFPAPIIFALLINEIQSSKTKKVIQTISYLPRFISTVVMVGMMRELLSPSTGVVNLLYQNLTGKSAIFFMNEAEWFRPLYILSDLWQFMGWNAIIYLAALAGVDVSLYESAVLDGANRFQQTIYITIPSIMSTILVVLIMSIGYILSLGFEKVLLMYTPINSTTSDTLEVFVYRMGLQKNNYSYGAAVGLFSGVVAWIVLSISNFLSKKAAGVGIF